MEFFDFDIQGLVLIKPTLHKDNRGFFTETYRTDKFSENFRKGYDGPKFVQDNHVYSHKNVIRGLHYQHPHTQGKLVRCIKGAILDVAVDIRPESPTFGKHISVELTEENMHQLWIPGGFAHGYAVHSDGCEVLYKCDEVYHPTDDKGIIYNDRDLNIDWGIKFRDRIVSDKDRNLPSFDKIYEELL